MIEKKAETENRAWMSLKIVFLKKHELHLTKTRIFPQPWQKAECLNIISLFILLLLLEDILAETKFNTLSVKVLLSWHFATYQINIAHFGD